MGGEAQAATSAFVGRGEQLEELRRAVDDAVAGSGALYLVTGEAGIGKTRLASELAVHAQAAGAEVIRAAAWEGDGTPAYWPWSQVIRAYAADRDADAFGSYRAEVLRLAPELSPEPEAATAVGDQPRFRLFDAVSSFLRSAAASRPLVVMLDDLHWADVETVMLLRFCGRELARSRVLLIGSFRTDDADTSAELLEALVDLARAGHELALTGLDGDEVRELLAQLLSGDEANLLAPDVHDRSRGNPLFVRELARLVSATGASQAAVRSVVPEGVRSVLARRLSSLSAESSGALRIASVVGEEFGLDVLGQATGISRMKLLGLLDECIRARIILESPDKAGRFRFTHALLRDVLYEGLGLQHRAAAHRRVAESLLALGAGDAELAYHFGKAGDPRAAEFERAAGRSSLDALAYEDAAAHFERALDALSPDAAGDARARLSLDLGEALLWAGDVEGAKDAYQDAAAIARRAARPDLLAEAALGFGSRLGGFEIRLFDRAQVDLLDEALAALGRNDSPLRALAMARLSIALTFTESQARRADLAAEAVEIARRLGDAPALVQALGAHCDAMAGPDHPELRLDESTEMIAVARGRGDRPMELLGRRHRIVALLELGDIAAVDAEIDAFASAAEALRQPIYSWYVPMWRAMRAMMDGRFDECRRLTKEVSVLGSRAHSENAGVLALVIEWNCLHKEGRLREAVDVLRRQLELVGGIYGDPLWVGLVAPSEYPLEAKTAIDRLAANDFAELPRDTIWLCGMSGVADACEVVGDAVVAEKAYRALFPYRHQFATDGTATACYGSMARFLGVLATVLGRFDDAAAHFEEALDAHRRVGAAPLVADTLRCYGTMLHSSGRRDEGDALLHEALSAYRDLAMDARVMQTEALLGAAGTGTAVFRRDGEYWTLAYAGRTSRLKDSKGLRDIAALLAAPGREIHVADLIGSAVGPVADEPVLDERARAAYRARLNDLREELEDAHRLGDVMRADRARDEMDFVAGELASALGLGGRARTMANPGERARKAVAQRVRNALRRISSEHPELGRHLERSLRMGSFCSYSPEHACEWEL